MSKDKIQYQNYFVKKFLKQFLGFNAISLIHLFQFKPRDFLTACNNAFASSFHAYPQTTRHSENNTELRIPEIALEEILADRKPVIRLLVARHEDGMLPPDQAMTLLSLLVAESPVEVLEIGTFMGKITRQMAENLPEAMIHTVDLPEDFIENEDSKRLLQKDDFHLIERRVVGRDFKNTVCASRIKQHFADTSCWDFHEAGEPTFFFIDGSHTYEYCKNDSERCFDLCKGKGVFLWHDCDEYHPGVVRFLSEWRALGRDVRRISGTPIAYWKN